MPRRALFLILCLLAFCLSAWGSQAMAQTNVVVVDDVEVEATGDTAEAAKQEAVTQGAPRRAIVEALRALASDPSTIDDLPLTDREVAATVIDYEVLQENSSLGRYSARMRFRLRVDMIDRLFETKGLRYAQPATVPVLVVPILLSPLGQRARVEDQLAPTDEAMEMAVAAQEPSQPDAAQPQEAPVDQNPRDRAILWEAGGPWLASWQRRGAVDGLLPLLIPLGDIDDNSDLSTRQVVQRDLEGFEALAGRYGAGGILLVIAKARGGNGLTTVPTRLEMTVERFGLEGKQRELNFTVDAVPDEALEALYDRARDTVVDAVQEDWRRQDGQEVGSLNSLSVHVPVLTLRDWQEAQERLRGIARVREVRTDSINARQVKLVLVHAGRIDSLREALRERRLALALEPVSLDGGRYERSTGFDTQASYELSLLP